MAHPGAIPRETAEEAIPREIAEDRTFTELEMNAIIADRVVQETARATETLSSEKAALQAENTRLQNELDIAITGKEKAEKDFTDYKSDQAREVELAGLAKTREAKVREVATHLKDDFFTPERAARWAGMTDEVFDGYVADMAAAATPTASAETAAANAGLPGTPVEPKTGKDFWTFGKGGN